MKNSKHFRGKSDTEFVFEKKLLDEIHYNTKQINSIVSRNEGNKIITKSGKKRPKNQTKIERLKTFQNKRFSTQMENSNDSFIKLFTSVFLLKKEFDSKYVRGILYKIKSDLNEKLKIIRKIIQRFKAKIISKNFVNNNNVNNNENIIIENLNNVENFELIKKINNFDNVIQALIETNIYQYSREVKKIILNEFEKSRYEIAKFLEACSIKRKISFSEFNDSDLYDNVININRSLTTKQIETDIQNDEITEFIAETSKVLLFELSNFSYKLDYYNIAINCLLQKMKYSIIYLIEKKSHISNGDKMFFFNRAKNLKNLHLFQHIMILSRTFAENFYSSENKDEKKSLNLNVFSSIGRFILDNFVELIPKCKRLFVSEESIGFEEKKNNLLSLTFYKNKIGILYLKNYLSNYLNKKDENLEKLFGFYFNSKIVTWKNGMLKIESKKQFEICRVCEENIPINEFIFHINYCKVQKEFYEQMSVIKKNLMKSVIELQLFRDNLVINEKNVEKQIFSPTSRVVKFIQKKKLSESKSNSNFLLGSGEFFLSKNSKSLSKRKRNGDYSLKNVSIEFLFLLLLFTFSELNSFSLINLFKLILLMVLLKLLVFNSVFLLE